MPKCSVGSTDYVCNFFTQRYCVMFKILMFEISGKKGLCDVIWGSEVKTSDLVSHFARTSGASNTVCLLFKRSTNIQGWQNYVNRIYKATCDETSQYYESYVKEKES